MKRMRHALPEPEHLQFRDLVCTEGIASMKTNVKATIMHTGEPMYPSLRYRQTVYRGRRRKQEPPLDAGRTT